MVYGPDCHGRDSRLRNRRLMKESTDVQAHAKCGQGTAGRLLTRGRNGNTRAPLEKVLEVKGELLRPLRRLTR